jgi:hypothetical protein
MILPLTVTTATIQDNAKPKDSLAIIEHAKGPKTAIALAQNISKKRKTRQNTYEEVTGLEPSVSEVGPPRERKAGLNSVNVFSYTHF